MSVKDTVSTIVTRGLETYRENRGVVRTTVRTVLGTALTIGAVRWVGRRAKRNRGENGTADAQKG